jgi:hypothetical protein
VKAVPEGTTTREVAGVFHVKAVPKGTTAREEVVNRHREVAVKRDLRTVMTNRGRSQSGLHFLGLKVCLRTSDQTFARISTIGKPAKNTKR